MRIPELLAPAGNMDALRAALHFGADAVYGGMKQFGLRAFAGNFDPDQLQEAVKLTHGAGRKFYVTMNSYPFDDEMDDFVSAAALAADTGVDAAIVADPGAVVTLRKKVPGLPIHISTQANTVNAAAAELYRELGCERVILAREMSLERIRALHDTLGDSIQLETFVHGASCMAYSGRCMLSAYLTGRSGNRGECAQPCRWHYAVVEEKRPGVYMPLAEDERGTYLFSARDLCLMPLLPYFCEQQAALMEELCAASHRKSDTGFLEGPPPEPGEAEGFWQTREYVARVTEDAGEDGLARLVLKNRFFAGDELELMTPRGVRKVNAKPFVREKTGEVLETLGIAGEIIRMELPGALCGDMLRGPVRNHRME